MPVSIYAIYDRERLGQRLDPFRVVFLKRTHLL